MASPRQFVSFNEIGPPPAAAGRDGVVCLARHAIDRRAFGQEHLAGVAAREQTCRVRPLLLAGAVGRCLQNMIASVNIFDPVTFGREKMIN